MHHTRSERPRPIQARRRAGDDHHQSRLGADHEIRDSNRHRSRRAHVSCRHCQPGAWRSGGRRHGRCHRGAQPRSICHGFLRRRRSGICLRRHRRDRRRGDGRGGAARHAHEDHVELGQSRNGISLVAATNGRCGSCPDGICDCEPGQSSSHGARPFRYAERWEGRGGN